MKLFSNINSWFSGMGRAFRGEFRAIFGDKGVLIFFVLLPLLYPVTYTLIYNPEVVRKLPVAVVDDSRTFQSRDLVRKASASPAIDIYAYCNDMAEARGLMASTDVFGILHIPGDYARKLGNGETANVSFFCDMSLLLRYRTFVSALTDLQIQMIGDMTADKIDSAGLGSLTGGEAPMLFESESNFLGDTEQGFASFVIPGIVILILQQSMILGICMLGGTWRERRLRGCAPAPPTTRTSALVWGKALAYTVFYLPLTIYVLRFIPEMFDLPHYGSAVDYLLFIFPLLLATAFLGQALNFFVKDRESVFVVIVFTSVVFLFLSGLTWPRYAMSDLWKWVGNCVPATWGVEGFIQINSNAATLAEVGTNFCALWILAAVYMLAACWVTKYITAKDARPVRPCNPL